MVGFINLFFKWGRIQRLLVRATKANVCAERETALAGVWERIFIDMLKRGDEERNRHKKAFIVAIKNTLSLFYVYRWPRITANFITVPPPNALQRRGFRVVLSPVEFKDLCLIELCGHEVFRCKIKSLMFNMPPHRDPVCQRAIVAVEEAFEKLARAQYYVWLWAHIENEMFKRSEYAPQDFWSDILELPPLAGLDCADCCHIIIPRWQNRSNKRYLIRICTRGCCASPEVIAIPKKIPDKILKKYYYLFFFLSKLLELIRCDNDLHVQMTGSRIKILDPPTLPRDNCVL